MRPCPCGIEKDYTECCGVFIEGQEVPLTPEALMRSRYSAYTQANIDYIARTMKSPAKDRFDPNSAREWAKRIEWLKLEVKTSSIPVGLQDARLGAEFTRDLNSFDRENSKEYSLYFESFPDQTNLKVDVKSDASSRILKSDGYIQGTKGFVEFIAYFKEKGETHTLHEMSEFRLDDGKWYYVDGKSPTIASSTALRVGRNDQCPCGSGKKYKKCCLLKRNP